VSRNPDCVGVRDSRKGTAAMDAIEVLKTRRSVRTYKGEPVPKKIIEDIVDCGRLAATAINIQPWEFVVVTDPGMLRRIAKTTDYGKFNADAPVCVLVLCRDTKYYLEDGSGGQSEAAPGRGRDSETAAAQNRC